jgi:hypothetical protein
MSPEEYAKLTAESYALASLIRTTGIEWNSLTPDEQKDELYQLTVKVDGLKNTIDAAYESFSDAYYLHNLK